MAIAINPIAGIRNSGFFLRRHRYLNITANKARYAKNPKSPMVTKTSTNILWARSKRVSKPDPLKNCGLKYLENGILKFSGPQPKITLSELSLHPFSPACQAQIRVWTVLLSKEKSVTRRR